MHTDIFIDEIISLLPEDQREAYKKIIEEANISPIKITVGSDYKNPLSDAYTSNGGLQYVEYSTNTDHPIVILTLQTINRIIHYQAFFIDGVISTRQYKEQKQKILNRAVSLCSLYLSKIK